MLQGCRRPETGSDSPVVARTPDFDGRGGDHTAEGGHPAPEPQGAPRGVRAVPKPFPDDFPEDSLPASSQVVQAPRWAALTTVFEHQVFEAIVRSNGWDNDTATLQLFSHLEGDALNVAHLVPLAR